MARTLLGIVALGLLTAAQIGCRACQGSAYDYASPVAGDVCGACAGCRCGSVHAGESAPAVVHSPVTAGDGAQHGVVIEEEQSPLPAPPEGI